MLAIYREAVIWFLFPGRCRRVVRCEARWFLFRPVDKGKFRRRPT